MHAVLFLSLCLTAVWASTSYTLVDNFSGATFFNNFQYFTRPDPTHGYVYYASASESSQWGYTYVSNNVVYIRSDNTSIASGSGRGSVRILSNKNYNSGLFVFDVIHMPIGCGTWPSIWTVDEPAWPYNGEIDVIEGVNNANYNSMTLHTQTGCTMPTNPLQTGKQTSTDCQWYQGCDTQDLRTTSYGSGFNANGGGVHVMLWTSSGVKIWFFPRNAIPSDISSSNPNPDNWGTPASNFPFGSSCPTSFFKNHAITVDNTFCGDWAGATYSSMGCPGTCQDFVQNNPSAFSQAYWAINSFKVYQPSAGTTAATSATTATTAATSATATTTTKSSTTGSAQACDNVCVGNNGQSPFNCQPNPTGPAWCSKHDGYACNYNAQPPNPASDWCCYKNCNTGTTATTAATTATTATTAKPTTASTAATTATTAKPTTTASTASTATTAASTTSATNRCNNVCIGNGGQYPFGCQATPTRGWCSKNSPGCNYDPQPPYNPPEWCCYFNC